MKAKLTYIVAFLVLLVLGLSVYLAYKKSKTPPPEVHYHAGFVVFKDGQKVDFSDSKYMYIKPCSANPKAAESAQTIQMEKAHLHDGIGDVVHIEASGAKWKDLFTNIGFPIDYASAEGYINGNRVSDFQDTPINPYDSLVVFIGKVDTGLLSQSVSVDHIKEVASKSVECGI